jgi:predicted transcriptional regulator
MADNLKELTASIVASYVESNKIGAADLPSLIRSTYTALSEAGERATTETDAVVRTTAAQIRKSVTPDALISFIDGKPYRMLKRHLTTHGFNAKTYQERYGLPSNYPMTAANYSAARSALATKMGLGRKAEPALAPAPKSTVAAKPALKGARKSPAGEKAGPGARVPKAVRSTKAKNTGDDGLG